MLMWRSTLPVRAGSKSFAVSIAHARVSREFAGISEKDANQRDNGHMVGSDWAHAHAPFV